MEIKKILSLKSPVHLYHIIESRPEILDSAQGDVFLSLRFYQDLATEYLYGCKCEEDKNWERLKSEYGGAIRQDSIVDYLRVALECDGIEFCEDYE